MGGAAVPEASVDKDTDALAAEHEVGTARQFLTASPADDSGGPHEADECQLSVLVPVRADAGHHLAPFLGGEDVVR